MTRFSDAGLLTGNFAHMAAEFRAGKRTAPGTRDWRKAANDTPAEEAAQDVAKHIFALQQSIDGEKERIEILSHSGVGQMKVMGLVPGEGDLIRIDGVLPDGKPVASLLHTSQLSLTFIAVPLEDQPDEDDGLQIGFLIFDELKKRKKKRVKKMKKLSLSMSRKMKMKPVVKLKKTAKKI